MEFDGYVHHHTKQQNERGHEGFNYYGLYIYSTNLYCRHLWYELRLHTRAALQIRLPNSMGRYDSYFYWYAFLLQTQEMALTPNVKETLKPPLAPF